MNEKKTVSFSSTPLERSKNIISTPDCLDYMTNGSDMIKMRANGRQYKRTFFLDLQANEIRWFPSNKRRNKARIPIDEVREIRRGIGKSGIYSLSECAFTIVYGADYDLLSLIASSAEEANVWIAGLTRLLSKRGQRSESDILGEMNQTRDKWLQGVFSEADYQNKGFLDELDVIQLMKSLNSGVNTLRIKHKLKEVDVQRHGDRGRLTSDEFVNLFKEISTRPEIFFLLVRYSTNGEFLTVDDLLLFLEAEQGMTGITLDYCAELIHIHEPSPEAKQKNQMGIDGFTAYLSSSHCAVFDPENLTICQDMTQPLSHYFISGSYNTYLMEDQLKGPSSVNGFIRALSAGCRFIKMDIWDGANDEPIIYHGNTLTSKLNVRQALEQISKFAFVSSKYPLILVIENHCSIRQQFVLLTLLKLTLGDCIYLPDDKLLDLPSPDSLMNKIILLGKKIGDVTLNENAKTTGNDDSVNNLDYGYVSEEDENFEFSRQKLSKSGKVSNSPKMKLMKELSDMFYFNNCRFDDSKLSAGSSSLSSSQYNSLKKNSTNNNIWQSEISFLSESHAVRLANEQSYNFMRHNKDNLVAVYPNITRVDSSNYNPQDLWNCGCQIVTLNYQTIGLMMDLNAGFFSRNGGCGYVLKPEIMRHQLLLDMHQKDGLPDVLPQTLHIRIISAQQLPKPRGSTAKGNVLDPYIVIQICGNPSDCSEERTKTVHGNSYNPVFDESFEFEVSVTQMALVRFLVLDDDSIGDDFIGQYTVPFDCLQTGYRNVRLLNCAGDSISKAYLFVHIAVTNKRGGGKSTKRGRSVKSRSRKKYNSQIKKLGFPVIDDILKQICPVLKECFDLRQNMMDSMIDLRESCNLPHFCNIKQCIRSMANRLNISNCNSPSHIVASPSIICSATNSSPSSPSDDSHSNKLVWPLPLSMTIDSSGIPKLTVVCNATTGAAQISDLLKKSVHCFNEVMQVCKCVVESTTSLKSKIQEAKEKMMEYFDGLSELCEVHDIKTRKATRIADNFVWNIRLLQGQSDLLSKIQQDANDYVQGTKEAGQATGLLLRKAASCSLSEIDNA